MSERNMIVGLLYNGTANKDRIGTTLAIRGRSDLMPLPFCRSRGAIVSPINVRSIDLIPVLLPDAIPRPTHTEYSMIPSSGSGSVLSIPSVSNRHALIEIITTRASL